MSDGGGGGLRKNIRIIIILYAPHTSSHAPSNISEAATSTRARERQRNTTKYFSNCPHSSPSLFFPRARWFDKSRNGQKKNSQFIFVFPRPLPSLVRYFPRTTFFLWPPDRIAPSSTPSLPLNPLTSLPPTVMDCEKQSLEKVSANVWVQWAVFQQQFTTMLRHINRFFPYLV